jgi:hypothetical protein
VATVAPGSPTITYAPGALVMYDGEMYQCLQTNTNQIPRDHADAWKKLPVPIDDVRVRPGSPYAGMGVD